MVWSITLVVVHDELPNDEPVTVARATGPYGEIVLRRRSNGTETVDELIINGAFAMDSTDTSSERELARLAHRRGSVGQRWLVGGLGLGYTAAEALDLGVQHVDVVEMEPGLVQWARQRLTPTLSRVANDPRTSLIVADLADVVTGLADPPAWNAILLDVDNGPDFLIHPGNAFLYATGLLSAAYRRLTPGGRLAIWSQGRSPVLMNTLEAIGPVVHEHLVPVTRGGRRLTYAIYRLDRPPSANVLTG